MLKSPMMVRDFRSAATISMERLSVFRKLSIRLLDGLYKTATTALVPLPVDEYSTYMLSKLVCSKCVHRSGFTLGDRIFGTAKRTPPPLVLHFRSFLKELYNGSRSQSFSSSSGVNHVSVMPKIVFGVKSWMSFIKCVLCFLALCALT